MPRTLCALLAMSALIGGAHAAITVPGANGSDGPLNLTSGGKTIDLSLAAKGQWDGVSPTAGNGIYDGDKWAAVYHYSSVNVAGNLYFKNNPARSPVIWLVNGDVTISGLVELSGSPYNTAGPQAEPGPGGYLGGKITTATGVYTGPNGPGWGPGGGQRGSNSAGYNGPGTGSGTGAGAGQAYGTASLVPLMGGSGGGGNGYLGGAGGGAILIAATGTITINGIVRANGGSGFPNGASASGGGSGGAIRLVADTIAGAGTLSAVGGNGSGIGANGRIRIEGNNVSGNLSTTPLPAAAKPASPALVFPDAAAPSVRIVSVGANAAPSQPQGETNAAADVLPDIAPTTLPVVIETKNIPVTSHVNLRVAPIEGDATLVPATLTSGNATLATWTANVSLPAGSTALQVRVEPLS